MFLLGENIFVTQMKFESFDVPKVQWNGHGLVFIWVEVLFFLEFLENLFAKFSL